MAMAMACNEPQFLELNEAIEETELRKQKTETGDTNAPMEDHVQKFNTEEGYDSEVEWNNGFMLEEHVQKANTEEDYNSEEEWNNGFMLEEHVQIQKDNAEEAKKEKERKEKEKKEDYDSDEDWNNLIVYDPNIKRVRCFANESLKWYNRQTGAKYKLKRVLEATATWRAGFSYTITFVAEECGSDEEPDEPALEYLKWVPEGDEKVVYNSGDDKPSDKLFWGVVYWELPGSKIKVRSCVIKTEEEAQKDNTEEAKEDECKSLKSYNRKTKKKRIRSSRTPRNTKNRCGFFMWKDAAFWVHQCIQKNKKQKILWLALGICFYYIWAVLSKTKE